MLLKNFRLELAVALCKTGDQLTPTRGRKRKESKQDQVKKRGNKLYIHIMK